MNFRLLLLAIAVIATACVTLGSAPDEAAAARERKIKIALALSGPPVPTSAVKAECGQCRPLAEVIAAAKAGPRVAVIFVGGCEGRAKELSCDAAPAVVASYTGDRKEKPAEKRIVLLGRFKADEPDLYVLATLPADISPAALKEALGVAIAKVKAASFVGPPAPTAAGGPVLNWYSSTAPANCPDGRCPLVPR